MNEELKIIIKAVTDGAKKPLQDINRELEGMKKKGSEGGKGVGGAMKAIGSVAVGAVAAVAAVTTALVALGNASKQYRAEQAKLNAAFMAASGSAEQAGKTYNNLYRFLGDSGKSVEAAGHLAQLTTNEQELAEWTTALQGVYATFGDSLPIEGLTEAANETAKVGTVTGTLADALNWAGVSEDAFNASLAACNSEAEREALIRGTLNGLYSDAAKIYEANNAEIIAANEAQARLDATTGRLGTTIQPLLTAFTNLSNVALTALEPAITVIANAMTWLINVISKAISFVSGFIGALTGAKSVSGAAEQMASGFGKAAGGVGNIEKGLESANSAAKELKRTTAGFDELNKLSSAGSSGSAGSTGAAGGGGGSVGPIGGFTLDTGGLTGALDVSSEKIDAFVSTITEKFNTFKNTLKEVFSPSTEAWSGALETIKASWDEALPNFTTGFENIKIGFGGLIEYILNEFVPNFTNSFSTNLAPVIGDLFGVSLEEAALSFESFTGIVQSACENILTPAIQSIETVFSDVFAGIGTAWEENGEPFTEEFQTFTEGIRTAFEDLYYNCIEPVWMEVQKVFDEVWTETLKPLWDDLVLAFTDIGTNIMILWNTILKPIIDWVLNIVYPQIVNTIRAILGVVKTVIQIVSEVIKGVINVVSGLIKFITGVFTGDWKKAWDGIKQIFSGIWQAIWGIVKGIVNLIIDGINLLWTGIYNTVSGIINGLGGIAGAVGDLFGKDWSFSMPKKAPLIPKLAQGGIVNGATLAMIGERGKEAVLPLENNTEWMDKLADRIALRNNTPSRIVLMLDGKELGYAAINSINGITAQTGQLQLRMI